MWWESIPGRQWMGWLLIGGVVAYKLISCYLWQKRKENGGPDVQLGDRVFRGSRGANALLLGSLLLSLMLLQVSSGLGAMRLVVLLPALLGIVLFGLLRKMSIVVRDGYVYLMFGRKEQDVFALDEIREFKRLRQGYAVVLESGRSVTISPYYEDGFLLRETLERYRPAEKRLLPGSAGEPRTEADYGRFDEEKAQKQQRMELVLILLGTFIMGALSWLLWTEKEAGVTRWMFWALPAAALFFAGTFTVKLHRYGSRYGGKDRAPH
ncbi:hypothetical protein PM3016_6246 [Paenibacillus mucilaginosus 3016]|uniref:Uncharacterized protein n=1 Tax=Paenibacillus mucilaginosus 3016 TaxID=1116391 RepID=H6NBD6_9BACL|nr:hypothetical protein [Paenibacillus mucilaginosus]AFC32882.1 hypothetical protein PM3016_6246 [Paenibacillus mucilaginosus 3016]WFA21332.1 hypothetical protein ERY13_31030 [Paenibacillus mucilaginosus]